jgi:hypothetical protein
VAASSKRQVVHLEVVDPAEHAGTAIALLDVADLELHAAAGRAVAIPRHRDPGALPDDIPVEADPLAPLELEADARRLRESSVNRFAERDRLQNEQAGPDPARMGRQPAQERRTGGRQASRQVDDEQVDRSTRQQGAREPEPLDEVRGTDDDEPAQVDAASDRLERIEATDEVQPGDDGTACLRLGDHPKRERRLARRCVALDRHARGTRQPAGGENRVERRETGRRDVCGEWRQRMWRRLALRLEDRSKRPLNGHPATVVTCAVAEPDRRAAPARLESRESGGEAAVGGRHDRSRLEQMFYFRQGCRDAPAVLPGRVVICSVFAL